FQRRRSAGAGAEQRKWGRSDIRLLPQPLQNRLQPGGQKIDIKPRFVFVFLFLCKQIQKQGAYRMIAQLLPNVLVSRTEAAAAASVSEDNNAAEVRRQIEISP